MIFELCDSSFISDFLKIKKNFEQNYSTIFSTKKTTRKGRSSSDDKRRRARREMDNAAAGLSSAQLVGGAGDPFPRVIWRNSRKHRGRRSFTDNELAAIFDHFLPVRKPLRNIIFQKYRWKILVVWKIYFLRFKNLTLIFKLTKNQNSGIFFFCQKNETLIDFATLGSNLKKVHVQIKPKTQYKANQARRFSGKAQ